MGLRFSENGPEFPQPLVDAMLAGEVVFLCGAGVSTPQLPSFGKLVDQVYERVQLTPSAGEAAAIKAGRPEEALGALSRRLADRELMRREVADLLTLADPDLGNHRTLLRLSRDLENRVALITTNFDVLFEKALALEEGADEAKRQSLAGQALPAPGASDFAGVIHLHGRLADTMLGLEASPFVLLSSEYGEAYMRSGWASRFLFDLMRCRTVVLVGYSAGDAPVRYFLNLLEADRERFRDLRPVYALDAASDARSSSIARWETVAVRSLPYRKDPGDDPHGVLWRDLAQLAALVEGPKQWRRQATAAILAKVHREAEEADLERLPWLLKDRADLYATIVVSTQDPAWFDWLSAQKVLSQDVVARLASVWCGKDWTSRDRLDAAIRWRGAWGEAFTQELGYRLFPNPGPDGLTGRAWHMVATPPGPRQERDVEAYRLAQRLGRPTPTDQDLREAVRMVTPRMELGSTSAVQAGADGPQHLRSLLFVRLEAPGRDEMGGLVEALEALEGRDERLLELCTGAIGNVIASAWDADLISPLWDDLSEVLPAVEPHPQNEFHGGIVHLANLLTTKVRSLAETDAELARAWTGRWRHLHSRVGLRLWLDALRDTRLSTPDEVAHAILDLPHDGFWNIRRELMLVMSERLGGAAEDLVEAICTRVLDEAPGLYAEFGPIPEGQTDWREHARDRETWLRLSALRQADVLPPAGQAALAAIADRHPFLAADFGDEDLFGYYMGPVRTVEGEPTALVDAQPEERLARAHESITSPDWTRRMDWRAFAAKDPGGALEALEPSAFGEADLPLWKELIGSLAWPSRPASSGKEGLRTAYVRRLLLRLDTAPPDAFRALAPGLVELLPLVHEAGFDEDRWWDRVWAAVEADEAPFELRTKEHLLDVAINRPSGRMADHLVQGLDRRQGKRKKVSAADSARLALLCRSRTDAGWLARARLVQDAGFLLHVDRKVVQADLVPWLVADDLQGQSLRATLVRYAPLGSSATRAFKSVLLRGVRESEAASMEAMNVVSKLLRPLLSRALSGGRAWGLKEDEVRGVLGGGQPAILEGTAELLRRWLRDSGQPPEKVWREAVRPVFDAVWPKEQVHRRAATASKLAAVAVAAGAEFPDAFRVVRPYLAPSAGSFIALHFVESSSAPEMHPQITLQLLWAMCGPGSEGDSTELGKLLDRLVAQSPALATDRRLQWLEQRTIRYE